MAAGEDFDAFRKIEALDSDGDGHSNKAEIDGGSNAGSEASTPDNPGRRWKRRTRVPVPRDQLLLVFGRVESISAFEGTLSRPEAAEISKAANHSVILSDRFATLYFALNGGERDAVALFRHFKFPGEGRFDLLLAADTAGRVKSAILLAAGGQTGSYYRPYLDCIVGHDLGSLPSPRGGDCKDIVGRAPVLDALAGSARSAEADARPRSELGPKGVSGCPRLVADKTATIIGSSSEIGDRN